MKNKNLIEEVRLRRLIREAIKIKFKNVKKYQNLEEQKLRKIIRALIVEGDLDSDTKPAPYASTPINALADAFNQILPVLKAGLRKLAKPEERLSYRAHVLGKFGSIFNNLEGLDSAVAPKGAIGEGDLQEQEEDDEVTITIDDPDRIMPSDGKEDNRFRPKEKSPEETTEEEFESFKLAGENPTGARVAFETINDSNIQQVLADKRKLIAFDPEYKDQFKRYAMYNAGLWLATYEKELADSLGQEPAFTDPGVEKPFGAQVSGQAEEAATDFGDIEALTDVA